ncbi:hypothetical protein AYI96_01635 [Shewanella sp. MSW]|nr:hypothetical protein AYI96_01635 [Shewanella sp. MSW]
MPRPRRTQISLEDNHCCSRVVRRAFLCDMMPTRAIIMITAVVGWNRYCLNWFCFIVGGLIFQIFLKSNNKI